MNKKKLGMFFVLLLCTNLFCEIEYPEPIKDIDDIPDMCAYLMDNLLKQKCDSPDKRNRLLPIKYWNDGKICACLTWNTGLELGVFACKQPQGQAEQGLDAGELILMHSEGSLDSRDDIYVRLKRAYINAIECIRWNWTLVASDELGSLVYPNPLKDYLSFYKTKLLQGEADLIMSLACKFGLANEVICSDCERFPTEREKVVYLWIKKSAKRKFDQIFKFKYRPLT